MKREIILASHNALAMGMKKTLEFIIGEQSHLHVLNAYMDNTPVEKQVATLMKKFESSQEVVVFTDMMAGSVNQKFFQYRLRPHTQIVTGMNLPVVMAVCMEPSDNYLTPKKMRDIVKQAREQLMYVNDIEVEEDDDDE